MQSQINICHQASYGDFIVWSKSDIYTKRILPDNVFWNRLVEKLPFSKHVCYLNWWENFTADLPALFRILSFGVLTIKGVLLVIVPLLILVMKAERSAINGENNKDSV